MDRSWRDSCLTRNHCHVKSSVRSKLNSPKSNESRQKESHKDMIFLAIRLLFILSCGTALLVAAPVDLPAGTTLQIRLLRPISTNQSKPNDPIEAVTIAPAAGLPAGARIRG